MRINLIMNTVSITSIILVLGCGLCDGSTYAYKYDPYVSYQEVLYAHFRGSRNNFIKVFLLPYYFHINTAFVPIMFL